MRCYNPVTIFIGLEYYEFLAISCMGRPVSKGNRDTNRGTAVAELPVSYLVNIGTADCILTAKSTQVNGLYCCQDICHREESDWTESL